MNDNEKVPAPFAFSPSQSWDGNDGRWSSFIVRVGNPPQSFRILPSTTLSEIWIPSVEACERETDPQACAQKRGVIPFNGHNSIGFQKNESSSFKLIGIYNLILEHKLSRYSGNGMFGFDTVGLQVENSGGLELSDQVVAGIATKDFYLGSFGLGPKPSNFSNFENPQPSFMQTLRNRNVIPSVSYGYTAGAAYQMPQAFGSLTLGGYDKNRFTPLTGDVTGFPFSSDDSRVLSIGIQSISATSTLRGAVTLMSNSIISVIDSTVPHLWLPRAVCDEFEQSFGLVFEPTTGLYLLNTTTRESLVNKNPTVTIQLGNSADPASWTRINLPYGAFDLVNSNQMFPNSTYYFPLRRAANESEYTLGRTFLQEAYVISDYERATFSVHQAKYQPETVGQELVPILPPGSSTNATTPSSAPSKSAHLGKGAIAGITIGGVLGLLLIALISLLIWRRKTNKPRDTDIQEIPPIIPYAGEELLGARIHEMEQSHVELKGSKFEFEIDSSEQHLASDDYAFHELSDKDLPETQEPQELAAD